MDGQKNIADTWTASRRSTSLTPHPSTSTRAPSRWRATMRIVKLDQWKQEKTSVPLRKFSQVFDKKKDNIIPLLQRTREQGKDHSMKHCEQNYNGWVNIGGLISHNFLPHHLHKIGGSTNIKTLNGMNTKTPTGKITSGEKSEGHRLFAKPMWQPRCEILAHS